MKTWSTGTLRERSGITHAMPSTAKTEGHSESDFETVAGRTDLRWSESTTLGSSMGWSTADSARRVLARTRRSLEDFKDIC